MRKRRQFTAEFKARVVRAALKEDKTLGELASQFDIHPNQITQWKKQVIDGMADAFSRKPDHDKREQEEHEAQLYQEIGKLKVDLDWLKKKGRELGIDC